MLHLSFGRLRCGLYLVLCLLAACGGSDNNFPPGELNDPNVFLSSIEVENHDIDFDPRHSGPYFIQVANEVTSVSFTATAGREGLQVQTYQTSTLFVENSTEIETIDSGARHTFNLAEGTNIITVRARDPENFLITPYTIIVNRVSTTASLAGIRLGDSLTTSGYFAFNEAFDPETFAYTVDVPYENCSGFIEAITNNKSTGMIVATPDRIVDPAVSSDAVAFNIAVGETPILIDLISEDRLNTARYSLTITRAAGTASEQNASARFASLSVSNGDFSFYCNRNSYGTHLVNNNVSSVDIVAVPEVAGATITINEQAYVAGEVFSLPLESDGSTTATLVVTSADDSVSSTYTIPIVNRNTNVVRVNTAEALQEALKNAQPLDDIRVAPGVYSGVASVEASGSASAHFASSASGTADEKIYLTAQTTFRPSVLQGEGTGANAVLEIRGDNWLIAGLKFANAQHGLVLDAASSNIIDRVEVFDTGAQNLVLRNGSSNNLITRSRFGSAGAEAIAIGSDSADWASNPIPGSYQEGDDNNTIHYSFFASSIRGEGIEVNEGATATLIESNTFESGSLADQSEASSLLRIQGNDTVVRYNSFYHSNDAGLEEVIAVTDAWQDWHSLDWGENTAIYQNVFDLSGANVPLVRAQSSATWVSENQREAGATLAYEGSGIDEGYSVPVYQIAAASQDMCVGYESVAFNDTVSVDIAHAQTCVDGDTTQQWKFLAEKDGYFRIQNVADSEVFLYPASTFIQGACSGTAINSVVLAEEPGSDGKIYHWRLRYDGDDLLFLNKSNENFQLSMRSDADQEGLVVPEDSFVLMCTGIGHELQRFRLIQQ